MVKAICFNLDGVYFTEAGKKAFHKALVDITGDEDKVVHVLYKSDEMRNFVTGKMTEEDFWNYFRDYLGIELSDSELRQLWIKGYEANPDVRKVVLETREKGYKACICSNNNPARVAALQERFKFLDDFDVVVFSYKVGNHKPSKEIFEALVKEAGCEANELAYADDNPERIQGAQDLGINTFIYESFEQFVDELKKLGVNI
ncbi:HAD-IA family hydrolase [Candidatus Dojkabacteria bacterium]|nr:HAD-IA family hydrolase [Candidatus Dojkabacteria bacterium]